jgi:prepilin-type N-terminal cleavage/methylation domain-containing protein
MNKLKNNAAGFTLVELLIVVIIVAVLAAVGVPLMRGNVERAKLSEADAGLGAIRGALRAKTAEIGTVPATADMNTITKIRSQLNFKIGDLTGRYFEDNDYSYTGTPGDPTATPPTVDTYCITVTGDTAAGETGASASKGDQVNTLAHSMNHDGAIYAATACTDSTKIIN